MATVTCHTEACSNAEIPIEVDLTFTGPDGVTEQVTQVVCGVCSQPITDVKR